MCVFLSVCCVLYVQPLKDIHLVLCVVVFLVVDVSILTIATGLSATRLVATVFPNKEGLMGVDVSCI